MIHDSSGEMSRGEMKRRQRTRHAPCVTTTTRARHDRAGCHQRVSMKKGVRGVALDALVWPDAGDLVYAYTNDPVPVVRPPVRL